VSLALYRKHRPGAFADMVGQDQVTAPLSRALHTGRVHHAYLFSGPRGCGKTTSARILARCLNCERGPTPDPCGRCQSCEDLAPGGPGSLDVIEIDAASHGGVDDARDLRERAFYAPAASRYKVYIVDEAHMVTAAGFNALLKIVEEPPEHVMFVFATTEPEKVIGTIRSRTHHYPFRLVPPGVLRPYLAEICAREGAQIDSAALPLVVRAGAGSVRDALSVLDQLIAGAGEDGVTYAYAAALLGFTDATLLDEVVDAFAAGDGATVFQVIDRVVEGGHDPRRFVTDLLERLRDLLVMDAVPDAEDKALVEGPVDRLARLRSQASRFGSAELSRAADVVNAGLAEMKGATAPRLHLELICARVLLPAAAADVAALLTRLERMERRLALGAPAPPAEAPVGTAEPPAPPAATPDPPAEAPAPPAATPDPPAEAPVPPARSESAAAPVPVSSAAAAPGQLDAAAVRRVWPEVLEVVKGQRRFTWMMLLENVNVAGVDGRRLTLAFASEGARKAFTGSGSDEVVRQAFIDVLGVDWRVEAVLDPSAKGGEGGAPDSRKRSPAAGPGRTPDSPPEPALHDEAEGGPADAIDVEPAPRGAALLVRELGAQVIGEYDAP
jgi:DNA polymerase-3 subunit gamma/tau